MKFFSAALCLTVLVNLAASKISNAVPSAKSHRVDSSVQKARPSRDLQYRIGEPVYTTLDQLQRSSPAYQPFVDYSNASPRTCGLLHKKKEPVQIQPVYIPVQQTPQCQQYQHITVPVTSYQQVSVPHTEYHQVSVPHTEYQQVSVPVHQQYQYHSVQQYYPTQSKPCLADLCGKSADGAMRNAAELPAQWYGSNAEYANPALEGSALYQAIGKSMASAYDMNADMNRNAQYLAPEINANAQYQEAEKSAQMYQMNTPSLELSRQAQHQPDEKAAYAQIYENAGVSEMKSATAPEMKSAAAPEMKSAAAQEINRNAAYQADGRTAQMYQMNAAADYSRAAYVDTAYADMNQRSAMTPEWNRNAAYLDMNQRSALTPQWGRNAYADMYQRDAMAPEWNRNAAYADMSQRTALIPDWSRNAMYQADERSAYAPAFVPEWSRNAAYADMYQRGAIAPAWSRNAAFADMYQRDAIAPEWGRNAFYTDMYQRDAIAPEWSRNAMYQPDGRHAYADVYKWNAPGRSGLYVRPQGFSRNAELAAVEKSAPILKAVAAPENKPVAAPESKPTLAVQESQADSAERTLVLSPIKGTTLTVHSAESSSDEKES